jgi:hypothetical protein
MRTFFALLLAASALPATEFPQAEISNGVVTAKLYLPDAERGYYRGTRFDWSGVIHSLRAHGHEYFGVWFERYDPKLHDAITGPVEEFRSEDGGLGYAEAPAGGTFVRIGVGSVRKPEERQYQIFRTYEIVDPGKWTVKSGRDWIEFTHTLAASNGYAYRYTKRISLPKGKSEMTIDHSLRNTGAKAIRTEQYNHNFFMFDGQPTGPAASVKFPFELKLKAPIRGEGGLIQGSEIRYTRELQRKESVFAELEGFGPSASDYDIRMEHTAAGSGVRITSDQPIGRLVYWSIRTTFCPEPYITLSVDPGKETRWQYRYQFYTLQ